MRTVSGGRGGEQAHTHLSTHEHKISTSIHHRHTCYDVFKFCLSHTEDVSSCLDVHLHVVLRVQATKVDTEQARVEPGGVAVTHITDTRLGLVEIKVRRVHIIYQDFVSTTNDISRYTDRDTIILEGGRGSGIARPRPEVDSPSPG